MNILIGCEFSGIVRTAFTKKGHNAISCDLLDSEIQGKHIKGDIKDILNLNWDMALIFPPCTHLCVSGARWFKDKKEEQIKALRFVKLFFECEIPKVCIENPVGIISTQIAKPTQIIQPYQFGHNESKRTCLWLKNLPKLHPTLKVFPENHSIQNGANTKNRWKKRSLTFTGIADAMANQWT